DERAHLGARPPLVQGVGRHGHRVRSAAWVRQLGSGVGTTVQSWNASSHHRASAYPRRALIDDPIACAVGTYHRTLGGTDLTYMFALHAPRPTPHATMLSDLRLAARALLRAKGLAAAAILCLALGIAGTTSVYSVTSALVLHPVPAADATGLVLVTEVAPSHPRPDDAFMAPANYLDLAQRNRSFSELAAFRPLESSVTGIDEPERVNGFRVTPSYFHLLGAEPALGRTFTADDARYAESPNVVILSDGFWRRHFGADPSVLGRVIRINDVPRTIVGVMPAGFVFPTGAELWTPQSLDGAFGRERDGRFLSGVLARLRPGVSMAQADADVHGIMQQLSREYPQDDGKW